MIKKWPPTLRAPLTKKHSNPFSHLTPLLRLQTKDLDFFLHFLKNQPNLDINHSTSLFLLKTTYLDFFAQFNKNLLKPHTFKVTIAVNFRYQELVFQLFKVPAPPPHNHQTLINPKNRPHMGHF